MIGAARLFAGKGAARDPATPRRLEEFRQSLAAHEDPGTARRRRVSRRTIDRALSRLRRKGRCPACEAQGQYATYVVSESARALELGGELPAIRDMYLACDGLCLPHWRAVEQALSSPDVRALVAEKQHGMVASLKAALEADLARGVEGEGGEGKAHGTPAYAKALAVLAGDTAWHPSAR